MNIDELLEEFNSSATDDEASFFSENAFSLISEVDEEYLIRLIQFFYNNGTENAYPDLKVLRKVSIYSGVWP